MVVDETEVRKLLKMWQGRATLSLISYNRAANRCRSWDTRIGTVVAVLTAVVGTSVFATLQEDVSTGARIVVGLVSVAAAIFSSVQTFAGLAQRIEEYERAARRWGAVRRKFEMAQQTLPTDQEEITRLLAELKSELDAAAESSPNAPARIRERVMREMRGEFPWWTRVGRKLRGLPPPTTLGVGQLPGVADSGPLTGS